ncbi:hypothetical protein [Acidisoma cladoniae]|uniref:hypothetical protein n=1 Tax=Acidisoma cladoniae TaxID=3040935 RepID=UPI002550734F|nr:hypothetical protein [Acidisoma sp. PAMC 29798]
MNPDTRRKLVGVLGLLASNHDGERAAAGLLATRLLKSAALTWEDIIPEQPVVRVTEGPKSKDWWVVTFCARNATYLSPWEQNFIRSLVGQVFFSRKQVKVVEGIATKLRDLGCK